MFLEPRRTKLSSTPSGCTSTHPSTTEKLVLLFLVLISVRKGCVFLPLPFARADVNHPCGYIHLYSLFWQVRTSLGDEIALSKAKFIDAKFLQDLGGRVPMEQFTRYPRVVKTLSLDLLPHFRWVDVRDIMLSCRDANDAGWIRHDR